MTEKLNINDDVKVLKLNILKENLKQNWNLDTDIWNEEFPHDFRFEDTYLQLSFILRDFNIDELKHLIYITNLFDVRNYNHDISTLINNYVKSCGEKCYPEQFGFATYQRPHLQKSRRYLPVLVNVLLASQQ